MRDESDRYIPALNRRWLTPAYDWVLRNLFRENRFKEALVEEAHLSGSERVLDIGCGTGTLTIALAAECASGIVVGLDGDPAVLERAEAKAAGAWPRPMFVEGLSYALPYADGSFDRVTSCLMLHHLTGADKERSFREVLRVLTPGGWLHIADFGPPDGLFARAVSRITIHLEETRENLRGDLPRILRAAGFEELEEGRRFGTVLGTVRLLHARTPLGPTAR